MKKILILGAGMVVKPMVDYLLKNNFGVTMASRTKSKADAIIQGRANGTAVGWTTQKTKALSKLVSAHDLTVSLLPDEYHVYVARMCIRHKKNMVTTSYVSEEMINLENEAKKAGVLILNEIGMDPGFDHLTAMRIIDKVHEAGGKVKEFYSLCGALPAPGEANNPFGYKFSWSPRGVLKASNNGAKYLKNGELFEIPDENLFKNLLEIEFPGVGKLEVYPNRDSLVYSKLYQLNDAETVYRGTFRYPHWCESLDLMKALGLLSYENIDFEGKNYKEIVAEKIGVYPKNVKEKLTEKMGIELDHPAIVSMDWLGYFDSDLIKLKSGSSFDLTADLMMQKMMLPKNGRDMVALLHTFLIEKPTGEKEVVKSRLIDFATEEDTSISRMVALPAVIAAKLILNGTIKNTGVQMPLDKSIYEPVLIELENLGIAMEEQWGLPESEMPN